MGREAKAKKQRAIRKVIAVRLFAKVAPAIFKRHFRSDCCVNGTRVAMEVLPRFGLEITPLATRVMVFNSQMWKLIHEHNRFPNDNDELRRWVDEHGAWSVGSGIGKHDDMSADDNGWHGHLVAIGSGYLIDASAGQFSRPEKGIHMPGVIVLPTHDRSFHKDVQVFEDESTGAVVVYKPEPDNKVYEQFVGFKREGMNSMVAAEVLKAMFDELKPGGQRAAQGEKQPEAIPGTG